ncbi:hypothetical protein [Nocardia fluminea]|uniref:hypothetical protein n=1 Tax=Nocardia fluminea TaxID=134984 RepID=UPI0037A4D7C6
MAAKHVLRPTTPQQALDLATNIAGSSARRVDPPVRVSFVRDSEGKGDAPLARLVATGGRGGGVAIKLYLALLWRCSAPPYDTAVAARLWAALLGLPDPNHRGARRVTDALHALEVQGLIRLTNKPGEPSVIQLREESGRAEYSLPSDAYVKEKDPVRRAQHTYFKIPVALWTEGHIQAMSAPALAMLLVCLANEGATGKQNWWATTVFPAQYGLSSATRARGTAELEERGLLQVTKQLVPESPALAKSFGRERVRNLYTLRRAARFPSPTKTSTKLTPLRSAKRPVKPRPVKRRGKATGQQPRQSGEA